MKPGLCLLELFLVALLAVPALASAEPRGNPLPMTLAQRDCDAKCQGEVADTCVDANELPAAPGTLIAVHGSTIGRSSDEAGCGYTAGDAWYRLEILEPTTLLVETDGQFDSMLSLLTGACGESAIVDCDDDGGSGSGSKIGPIVVDAGTYFLVVDTYGVDEGDFILTLRSEAAGCGNGMLEAGESCDEPDLGDCATGPCADDCACPDAICGNNVTEDSEECDDGNTHNADDCDNSCMRLGPPSCEAAPELSTEPGVQHLSGSTSGAGNTGVGCGGEAGEVWYRLELDHGTYLTAATDGSFDSTLALFRDCYYTFPVLCDDDGGPGLGSRVGPILLAPGIYHVMVDGFGHAEGDFTLTLELAPTVCGDGIRERPVEQCDGGECFFGPCRNDCTCPKAVCGDGEQQGEEDCDGSDLGECKIGPCSNDCTCPAPICGNDTREGSLEHCDGEDLGICLAGPCRNDCRCPYPACGNGIREGYEDCDGTSGPWCITGCDDDCTCASQCGNGIREEEEPCDGDDLGSCNSTTCLDSCQCAPSVCGNNDRESGEECDGWDDDFCSYGPCRPDCECPGTTCGDGIRQGWEQCDGVAMGWCVAGPCEENCTCPAPLCGNGVAEEGEVCDGPNLAQCPVGPCGNDCTCPEAVCGNAVVEAGEACDDGATASGDSCGPTCTFVGPDTCEDAELLQTQWGVHHVEGTTVGASYDSPGCGGQGDTWYTLDLIETTVLIAHLESESRPVLGLYKGGCEDLNRMVCRGPTLGSFSDVGPVTLPPGRYHLTVDSTHGQGAYALTVHLAPPVCGNAIPEVGEHCDDGNPSATNGCDEHCELVGGGTCEDAVQLPLGAGTHSLGGTTIDRPDSAKGCGKAGDAWYVLDLAAAATVSFETDGRFDSYLTLLRGSCDELQQIQCVDEGTSVPGASRMGPLLLPAGRHFVLVDGRGRVGPDEGDFILTVRIQPAGCGNSVLELGESCDSSYGSCSYGSCRADCRCPRCGDGIVDPTEECDDADTVTGNGCHQCELQPPAGWLCDDARYLNGSCDCGCGLADPDCPNAAAWACDGNQCGDGFPDLSDNTKCFQPCGNGAVELGYEEQCDDGNTAEGDGCSPSCRPEPPPDWLCEEALYSDGSCTCGCGARDADCPERFAFLCNFDHCRIGEPAPEANHECVNPLCGNAQIDSQEQCDDANSIAGDGCDSMCLDEPTLLQACGAYAGAGAVAYGRETFALVLDQPSEVSLWTHGDEAPCPSEMRLRVYDSNGQLIATDDWSSSCPSLVVGLAAGSYVVVIGQSWEEAPLPPYVLEFRDGAQGCSACGNLVRQGQEECDNGSENGTGHGVHCFPDCSVTACGAPISRIAPPKAKDALFIINAAIENVWCDERVCDANANGTIQTNDALRVLRRAVGQPVNMQCPAW